MFEYDARVCSREQVCDLHCQAHEGDPANDVATSEHRKPEDKYEDEER